MKNDENILAKWLNNEITDSELESAEGADVLNELKEVINEVDQWSVRKYDAKASYKELQERIVQITKTKNHSSIWLKGLSLIGLAGLLLYLLFMLLQDQPRKVHADHEQNIEYAFEDGSTVWLNDGSSIQYESKDWEERRTIDLEGEALFKVTKGTPFIVRTANGSITVLGTQFNVRSWGKNLYVECYEGSVEVQSTGQQTLLAANESVNIIEGSMNDKEPISHSSPYWQNGISRFYSERLSVVCRELERQYNITINLSGTDRFFSGNFIHNDLENALKSICIPLDMKYEISDDKKSVLIE